MSLSEIEFRKKVGNRIAQLRAEQNMTTIDLADKMNMEGTSITRIEKGRIGLRYFTVYRFCRVFDISLEEFSKGM